MTAELRRRRIGDLLKIALLYRRVAWRDALQVQVRWITCPLWEVERRVPESGRVLEVGCGRGLLSAFLASASPGREVLGVDIDPAKIVVADLVAPRVRERGARLEFGSCTRSTLPEGPFDVVVFAEMLFLIEPEQRRELILRVIDRLAPGATVIVKEVDKTPGWKDKVNRFGTWVDMRVLANLEGQTVVNFGPAYYEELLGTAGFDCVTARLDRGYPFAHFIVVGTRQP